MVHNEASQKIYKAILIIQENTDPPEVNVLQNTLDAEPLWEYSSTGLYTATLSQEFTNQKTWINNGQGYVEPSAQVRSRVLGPNQIAVQTYLSGISANDVINEVPVEIIVFDNFKNYTQ